MTIERAEVVDKGHTVRVGTAEVVENEVVRFRSTDESCSSARDVENERQEGL